MNVSKGQMKARLKRIRHVRDRARQITANRIEKARQEKRKLELEDILINKRRFINKLMIEMGVTQKKVEEYFEIWKTEEVFKEFTFSESFPRTFCLSQEFNNLPIDEQNRMD